MKQERGFPCQQCGAKLTFTPGTTVLKCEHCGHENPIPQSAADIEELDFRAYLEQAAAEAPVAECRTVKCPACSGEVSLPGTVSADECPFCGTTIVTPGGSTRKIKPQSLLPFKVTRDQAREAFRQWVRSLWFAPGDLVRRAAADSGGVNGIYLPYWTYDCETTSYYTGERGEDYWATETYQVREGNRWVTRTRQVRKTRWYSVSGTVWHSFDDVLVLASESLPRKYVEELEPWDLASLVPYQDEYLSGFHAESYQVGLADGFERAKVPIDAAIEKDVCDDIGGDHQRVHSVRTRYDHITFKHLLLPVWLNAYRYRNRAYRFVVNARTGEVQGERPWSIAKILLLVLAGLGAVAAAVGIWATVFGR